MLIKEKNKISYMHFIMSVLVILIHSINNETKFENFFSIETGIGQFAVPLFYIISGFLFFRNIKFADEAINKVRNRVYTLLVPYLLWNLIYYAIYLLMKPGNSIRLYDIIDAAFNYRYNPTFWFMQQLILLTAISPVIFRINTSKNGDIEPTIIFIILLSILFVALGIDIPYINEDALIYYMFGALISTLYNKNKIMLISKKNIIYCILFIILAFAFNRLVLYIILPKVFLVNLYIVSIIFVRLLCALFLFYFFDLFFKYETVPSFMQQTFFLYAIHYMIVRGILLLTKKFLDSFGFSIAVMNGISIRTVIENIVFITTPIICVLTKNYLSKFLIKKFNKQYNILVGNR